MRFEVNSSSNFKSMVYCMRVMTMDGYVKRTQKKREAILAAAKELFFKDGVDAAGMAGIAKKAGVSQVTIYNYFGSKEGLIREVMLDYMAEKISEFDALLASSLPFPEKIEKMLFNKKAHAREAQEKGFLQAKSLRDPVLWEILDEFGQKKALPAMMELIRQGQREGYVDENISMAAILQYFNAFKHIMMQPGFFDRENEALRMELANLFFYGIRGCPEKPLKNS